MKINKRYLKSIIVVIPTFIIIIILINYGYMSIECPIYKIFHLYCPGCGITRAIISITKFNFYQAFRYNPFVVILLPFIFIYIFYTIYIYLFDKQNKIIKKIPSSIYYVLIILLIIYGILRNINMFSWLAPTKIV